MDQTTKIVLSKEPLHPGKNPFPLEQRLRNLKVIEHTYIVGIFDCCRSIIKEKSDSRAFLKAKNTEEQDDDQAAVNLILVFGCEPKLIVQAESPISQSLTEHLYSYERKNMGKVKLPEALIFYNHENKIEKTILVT